MQAKDIARFEVKVGPPTASGCRLWTAYTDRKMGYGMFWLDGTMRLAHRVAYTFYVGEIPDGLDVLHSCDTPACVEHAHLWLGTNDDNVADKVAKGRAARMNGELHPSHKLTEQDVLEIRRSAPGTRGLAKRFGVDRSTIRYIRIGRLWPHIGAHDASA